MRRVLATFGNGDCGRLGHSAAEFLGEEVPRVVRALLGCPVRTAAAGGAHTAALDDAGTVYAWGLNDRGQLGLGHDREEADVGLPQEVPLPEKAVAVAAGYFHTLCLGESGAVWAFGCNGKGQLGLGADVVLAREPRLVAALRGERRGRAGRGTALLRALERVHKRRRRSRQHSLLWGTAVPAARAGRVAGSLPQAAAGARAGHLLFNLRRAARTALPQPPVLQTPGWWPWQLAWSTHWP